MLAVREVTLSTGPPRFKRIFSNATLEIPAGRHTILYGNNASGKSTLVKLLLGKLIPESGSVTGGDSAAACYFEDVESQLFFSTVEEEISFSGRRDPEIEDLLLEGIRRKGINELSYSEKARLAFAAASLLERKYLIVDSPPADEKIDRVINIIAGRGERTLLLMLPSGEERGLEGRWTVRRIKSGRIEDSGRGTDAF